MGTLFGKWLSLLIWPRSIVCHCVLSSFWFRLWDARCSTILSIPDFYSILLKWCLFAIGFVCVLCRHTRMRPFVHSVLRLRTTPQPNRAIAIVSLRSRLISAPFVVAHSAQRKTTNRAAHKIGQTDNDNTQKLWMKKMVYSILCHSNHCHWDAK